MTFSLDLLDLAFLGVVGTTVLALAFSTRYLFNIYLDQRQISFMVSEVVKQLAGLQRYNRLLELQDRVINLVGPMIEAYQSDPNFEERITEEIVKALRPHFPDIADKEIVATVIRVVEQMLINGVLQEEAEREGKGQPQEGQPVDGQDDVHIMSRAGAVHRSSEMGRFYQQLRDPR